LKTGSQKRHISVKRPGSQKRQTYIDIDIASMMSFGASTMSFGEKHLALKRDKKSVKKDLLNPKP
jgi:hypothetical protein